MHRVSTVQPLTFNLPPGGNILKYLHVRRISSAAEVVFV